MEALGTPEASSEDFVAALRRRQAWPILLGMFFLSGATGLAWQTLWSRQLHLLLGTSTFAVTTTLAAFMAGLGIGGLVMARWVHRVRRPLRLYALLELGIAGFALGFPSVIRALEPLHLWLWSGLPTWAFGPVQGLVVGLVLLAPTAAMGATLPLLVRFAGGQAAAGHTVGVLYATNTAGAVFGTWCAAFVLLPQQGLWGTTVLAGGLNLALAAGAFGLSVWSGEAFVAARTRPRVPAPSWVLWAIGLAGVASLALEVAWYRLLGLMLGASVYAFSLMLLAFLFGIAVGGRLGGGAADRAAARGGAAGVARALLLVELGVGVLSAWLLYFFAELPYVYVWLFDTFDAASAPWLLWAMSLLLAGLVMTPPAVLMGMAFPLAVRAASAEEGLDAAVGAVYGANTVGGVVGAVLAGFVGLPLLGVQGTVLAAVTVNFLAALVVATQTGGGLRLWAPVGLALSGLLAVVPPPWDPLLMTAGMYKYVTDVSDHSRAGVRRYAVEAYDLLYYREGYATVVTVARNKSSQNIWLANNGKVDASTTTDMPTQILVSLLPMQFVERPEDVAVIGLASGITAGAVTLVPGLERLDVIELEPAIAEAARFFDAYNHRLLDDPRTRLVLNDGRHHLQVTPPGTYDVIVSEPSNPWLTGVSNLFTAEFFAMGKQRLKPGGVWAQWVQLYGMGPEDLRSLLGTFADAFDHVLIYAAAADADLVLIGADHPLVPDAEAMGRLLGVPAIQRELDEVDHGTPAELLAAIITDRDGALGIAGRVQRNTDDNMRIEHHAPLYLHRDTQAMNLPLLYRNAEVPVAATGMDALLLSDMSRSYDRRLDPKRAVDAAVWAVIATQDDEMREALVEDAVQMLAKDEGIEGDPLPSRTRRRLEVELVRRVRAALATMGDGAAD